MVSGCRSDGLLNVLQAIGLNIMKRNITMKLRKLELLRKPLGAISISMLLAIVFVLGVVIAGLTVYSAFIAYRTSIVQDMARADTKQVAELVFEHLYSVMRKGWTGAEIDDVTHRIHLHLPHHEVLVVRGEPLVRQFGDREGHARIREKDSIVADTLKTGQVQFRTEGDRMRYAFPILMASECVACHTISTPGEVNGVIAVSVPLAAMQGPIEGIVHPMMVLTLALTIALLLAVYVVLRRRVMRPMVDLTSHVSAISRATDYSRDIAVGNAWPRELQTLANSFNELMGQVRSSTDALRESSLRDPLTGLFNRRHFDAALEQAAVDASNGATSFAVLLLDLDRFKPINDKFGHAAGDAVLISVAKSLQGELRETDLAARIGGDEFALLALSTTYEEAQQLAQRLRQAIGQPELRFGHEIVRPICSIGVGSCPADGHLGVDVLHAADVAMYADKMSRNGRR
jgi:diguanylate cyclase (GGDEF)-like protein